MVEVIATVAHEKESYLYDWEVNHSIVMTDYAFTIRLNKNWNIHITVLIWTAFHNNLSLLKIYVNNLLQIGEWILHARISGSNCTIDTCEMLTFQTNFPDDNLKVKCRSVLVYLRQLLVSILQRAHHQASFTTVWFDGNEHIVNSDCVGVVTRDSNHEELLSENWASSPFQTLKRAKLNRCYTPYHFQNERQRHTAQLRTLGLTFTANAKPLMTLVF